MDNAGYVAAGYGVAFVLIAAYTWRLCRRLVRAGRGLVAGTRTVENVR